MLCLFDTMHILYYAGIMPLGFTRPLSRKGNAFGFTRPLSRKKKSETTLTKKKIVQKVVRTNIVARHKLSAGGDELLASSIVPEDCCNASPSLNRTLIEP